ncbi:Oidioi.mRNA.OKI2018_I69.PAR.g13029.t1.cds [Oikopleura dioica]|uniref:Oidioi.mRNA.OKI2018_I69.PAR.g13029.t1.cds n=1 Tax=Oikopleura dioica TaxID=34765 RepID=A0ABN7S694_OIKDI|nr:Oidioi.mRNA.OKI2018_I69.PAR.g13029.t1.cds [Oikopleura dioica]
MIPRKRVPPSYLRDFATGKYLEDKLDGLDEYEVNRLQSEARKPVSSILPSKKKRGRPRKVKLPSTEPTTLTTMTPISAASTQNRPDDPMLNQALVKGGEIDQWTTTVSKKVNQLRGVNEEELKRLNKYDKGSEKTTMAILSPAMISENSGIQFMTQLIAARNPKTGELKFPQELIVNKFPTSTIKMTDLQPGLVQKAPTNLSTQPMIMTNETPGMEEKIQEIQENNPSLSRIPRTTSINERQKKIGLPLDELLQYENPNMPENLKNFQNPEKGSS